MMKLNAKNERKVVFAAMSKNIFYLRERIIKFILEKGHTPMCAFMMFSYFLLDTVDKKAVIHANNDLIRRSDELWVFGAISTGVYEEIKLAQSLSQPIRYFQVTNDGTIFEPSDEEACIYEFDLEVYQKSSLN
jgi:hypothetical protein